MTLHLHLNCVCQFVSEKYNIWKDESLFILYVGVFLERFMENLSPHNERILLVT